MIDHIEIEELSRDALKSLHGVIGHHFITVYFDSRQFCLLDEADGKIYFAAQN